MNMTGATKNKLEIWILDKCKICGSPVHQHEVFYLYSKNKVVYRKAIYCYSHSVFSFQRTESISKYEVYGDLTKSHGWAVITGPPLHAETGLWRAPRGGHPSKNEKVWSKSVDGLRCVTESYWKTKRVYKIEKNGRNITILFHETWQRLMLL